MKELKTQSPSCKWWNGAPEIRINFLGAKEGFINGNNNITDDYFKPDKRKDINGRWATVNHREFRWSNEYGKITHISFAEEDGGIVKADKETIDVVFADKKYSITAFNFVQDRSKDLGTYQMHIDDNCTTIYGGQIKAEIVKKDN